MFGEYLLHVREKQPHIHCITNYVTANDCANILLAAGCSPIMADNQEEAGMITARCQGLLLNTGTPSPEKFSVMQISGMTACLEKIPVVLDPVGAGASPFRTNHIRVLLKQLRISAVRGNLSEIRALFCDTDKVCSIDADGSDRITEETLPDMTEFIRHIAAVNQTVIAVTGETDMITDGKKVYCIRNGCSMMKSVTGTGCQLSALMTAFIAANPEHVPEAAAAAVCAMGVCGETALSHLAGYEGSGTFRNRIIDAVYHLDSETLDKKADYQIL